MKSLLLTAKIAAIFALVLAVILLGTLALFIVVAGHDVVEELALLRAYQGVELAEEMELLLAGHGLEDREIQDFLRAASHPRTLELILRPAGSEPTESDRRRRHLHAPFEYFLEIDERRCRVLGPPVSEAWVPVYRAGEEVATLVVRGKTLNTRETHEGFIHGLLLIGVVGLAGVIVLALYLTAPLRRMSRSMDRVAAGELEHRVPVRGHDEVATMGRSFNAMADRIRHLLIGQKELMAGVSHELRSPLARMKLVLELLRNEGARNERVDELEAEVDAVDDLVEEILLASRIELGSLPLDLEELDLRALAEIAWERVDGDASRLQVRLDVDLADGARRARADRALLVRIFGNLFENAVRYAGRGRVTVSSRRPAPDGDRVELTVADQGPGVDEIYLSKLFEPFFRVDGSRSRKTGAGGLGLMIVRRAVEAHGGRVRAETSATGGLAVIFDLPAAGGGRISRASP